MQYNILHQKAGWGAEKYLSLGLKARAENVVKAINEADPDVLVLAERHDEWAGIPVDYSDTVDLAALLGSRYAFAEDRIENGATVPARAHTESAGLLGDNIRNQNLFS